MVCVLSMMGMLTLCFDPALLSADGRASRARLRRAEADLAALDAGPPTLVPPDELRYWHRSLEGARAQHRLGQYSEVSRLLGRDAGRVADAMARKQRFELAGDPVARLTMRHQQWQRFVDVNRIESPFERQIAQGFAAVSNPGADNPAVTSDEEAALQLSLDRAYDEAFEAGRRAALTVERDDRMTRRRSLPCPPAVPSDPAVVRRTPRVAGEYSGSHESFYPPSAKREGREGTVVIRAHIDASGCARQATVQVSSGDTDFDRAAVDWTLEAGRFEPAGTAAAPRAEAVHFRMRFELK
jgi:protein TonB